MPQEPSITKVVEVSDTKESLTGQKIHIHDTDFIVKVVEKEGVVVCTEKTKEESDKYMQANIADYMTEKGAQLQMTDSVPCSADNKRTHFIFQLT